MVVYIKFVWERNNTNFEGEKDLVYLPGVWMDYT